MCHPRFMRSHTRVSICTSPDQSSQQKHSTIDHGIAWPTRLGTSRPTLSTTPGQSSVAVLVLSCFAAPFQGSEHAISCSFNTDMICRRIRPPSRMLLHVHPSAPSADLACASGYFQPSSSSRLRAVCRFREVPLAYGTCRAEEDIHFHWRFFAQLPSTLHGAEPRYTTGL